MKTVTSTFIRQALRDDIRRLQAETSDHDRRWNNEKADMMTKMGERNKLVDDKMAYCKKLERNIQQLKKQVGMRAFHFNLCYYMSYYVSYYVSYYECVL